MVRNFSKISHPKDTCLSKKKLDAGPKGGGFENLHLWNPQERYLQELHSLKYCSSFKNTLCSKKGTPGTSQTKTLQKTFDILKKKQNRK